MSIEKAAAYAAKAHEGQYRKNSKTPYIRHPMNVAAMADGFMSDQPMRVVAVSVAWLHDTVEDDPNTTIEMIAKEFGRTIARNVYFLTDPPRYTGTRTERKEEVCRKMTVAPMIARLVKCCDVLDNLSDVDKLEAGYREKYIQEKVQLYEALSSGLEESGPIERTAIEMVGERLKEITQKPAVEAANLTAFNPK